MGGVVRAPINEAVYLLSRLEPERLKRARDEFPALAEELKLGQFGGVSEDNSRQGEDNIDGLDFDRTQVVIQALDAAKLRADQELASTRMRIATAKKYRKWTQITSLICSSGVLGTLALDAKSI